MKPLPLILTVATSVLATLPSVAADESPAPTAPKPAAEAPRPETGTPSSAAAPTPATGRRKGPMPPLDTDGDGVVSAKERRAAGENARKKLLERFDQDGDGQLSAAERQAADADREARLLARFDADGDGKLSADERKAARPNQPAAASPTPAPATRRKPTPGDKPLRLELRPQIMQKFDVDRDGRLSDGERAAARDALKARKRPKGGPKGAR